MFYLMIIWDKKKVKKRFHTQEFLEKYTFIYNGRCKESKEQIWSCVQSEESKEEQIWHSTYVWYMYQTANKIWIMIIE